jgi:hypothetical protein
LVVKESEPCQEVDKADADLGPHGHL